LAKDPASLENKFSLKDEYIPPLPAPPRLSARFKPRDDEDEDGEVHFCHHRRRHHFLRPDSLLNGDPQSPPPPKVVLSDATPTPAGGGGDIPRTMPASITACLGAKKPKSTNPASKATAMAFRIPCPSKVAEGWGAFSPGDAAARMNPSLMRDKTQKQRRIHELYVDSCDAASKRTTHQLQAQATAVTTLEKKNAPE